jgi:hypothetical protein
MNANDFSHILQSAGYKVYKNRSQCPSHGGKNLNLSFSDSSDGKLLMNCFSNHCSIESIADSLSISITDFFPKNDSNFNIKDWKEKKTKFEIEKECVKVYKILSIFSCDIELKKSISEQDKKTAREAMRLLYEHDFTNADYKIIIKERALSTAYARFNSLSFSKKYLGV